MMEVRGQLPLYVQLSEMIGRDIASGHVLVGERLPPEREMAKSLGTTVRTLRKALADLTEKGMLERKHGSGNYVRATGSPGSIYALFRLELVTGGGSPTATVLSVDRVPKDAGVGPIGPSREGHCIRRLRRLDGAPVALEEIWLDGNRAKRITDAHLSDSLYLYYKLRFGIWIARAEDRISVSSVPDWTTPAFNLPAGSTCGYIERFGSTSDGERIEFSRTWFDHRCARYVSRIK